jgi:hypothetical protein
MIRKILMIGTSLAALGLSGCDRQDRSPTQPDEKGLTGSARVALPSLPAGYLADSTQTAWFSLSITGPGMTPILKSWTLSPNHSEPVLVQGIPAGMRNFYGRLVRVDPGKGDTTITHVGTDSAYIQSGAVAEVHLYLKAAGSGSAHVCVEVEGWPADPTCIVPPPVINVAGCYSLRVINSNAARGQDTLEARLRITQSDTSLQAWVTWASGQTDSTIGAILFGETVYVGWGAAGSAFHFKAARDSMGVLHGWVMDADRNLSGEAHARPAPCLPEPPLTMTGCYRIRVTQPGAPSTPDTVVQGKLRLFAQGQSQVGTVDWGNRVDTSVGTLNPDGTIYFEAGTGGFYLKGHPDSLGFWGFFDDSSGIAGTMRADAISCEATVPGDTFVVTPKSTRTCYTVTQTDTQGKTLKGGLAVESRAGHSESDFFLRLKGFDFNVAQGSYIVYDDPAAVFNIRFPVFEKMFPSHPVEAADYSVNVDSTGELTGSITEAPPVFGTLGSLKGRLRACSESDFPM